MRTARIDGWRGRVAQGSGPILPRSPGRRSRDEADGGGAVRACVAVSDAPAVRSAVLLRLVLINGRRANSRSATFRNSARYSICWNGARDPADGFGDVFLCVAPTDLRKQAASLALLVEQSLKRDVFARHCTSSAMRDATDPDLYWERNGLVLWSKRLERERFHLAADGRGRHGVDERSAVEPTARWL